MMAYPDTPGHRKVQTSIVAAEALAPKLARLQSLVRSAIADAGENGLTANEVAVRLGMERWVLRPRTSELRRKGAIRDSGKRRPNVTGKQAIVWVVS
jgi:hypothetical protein